MENLIFVEILSSIQACIPCIIHMPFSMCTTRKIKFNPIILRNTVVTGRLFITSVFMSCVNGPFLTVNQSMFTEVEVANQWYFRADNNLCPTLHKRTCAFCL